MGKTITFADGTRVTGGALSDPSDRTPSFGLYAYGRRDRRASLPGRILNRVTRRGLHGGSWAPPWDADWLYWPDFGVPADSQLATQSIVGAFRRAQAGERVEVRCYGGKGRTGTILACMAVLAGVPPAAAVPWVRAVYSEKAVEREAQREWVAWFARTLVTDAQAR